MVSAVWKIFVKEYTLSFGDFNKYLNSVIHEVLFKGFIF